jgi:3-hydroxyacyl-[acyl-carrier-protein] dehydratase
MSDQTVQANAVPGLSPADEAVLRDALKRCSPATLEAALAYRRSGELASIAPVVLGIIERFVDPEHRTLLKSGNTDLRVIEDLGVDSLTMLEVVMLVEESLKITIKNEELRELRTLADINAFIEARVCGRPVPAPPRHFAPEAVAEVLPMQSPFLFVQEATVAAALATGRYQVAGTEFFLQGHFKNNPVLPASIMLEALGQLAVLFLLRSGVPELELPVDPAAVFFTGCEGVRCSRVVKPGETLALSVRPKRIKAPLAVFEGTVKVDGEKAAFAEEITLTFGYVVPVATASTVPVAEVAPAGAQPASG